MTHGIGHQTVQSNLNVVRLGIPDVIVVTPRRFVDERGYFCETFQGANFASAGINATFIQDNQSSSVSAGTIRGLHFQTPPKAQAKLVRVLAGSIFDVAVDLRRGSSTYGKWCGATLTADAGNQLFVPHGFAHGFCTLQPNTVVAYKVDNYYAPECDSGLIWNDSAIGISWPVPPEKAILSAKDRALQGFASFVSPFTV